VQQAAALMREHHVGAVVVTEPRDEGHGVCGLVTDRDLAIEVMARGSDGALARVSQLTMGKLVGASMHASVDDAVALMQSHAVRRLFVHDDDGGLIGLVSFDDVLRACADRLSALADVLRKGIERETVERPAVAAAPRQPLLRVPATGTAGWGSPQASGKG
jgi:signal-transduction protein with cAMP-binding, CBS, and nucleotidyltransferase domain